MMDKTKFSCSSFRQQKHIVFSIQAVCTQTEQATRVCYAAKEMGSGSKSFIEDKILLSLQFIT